MQQSKKESISIGIFFISLFFIGLIIFNVINKQVIIKISEKEEIMITQPFNLVQVLAIILLTISGTISFTYYAGALIRQKDILKSKK
jgi:hypothetical protein